MFQVTGKTWKLSGVHKLKADEDLVLENKSQTSFKISNREAAKKRNLPQPLTKISLSAEKPTQEIFFFVYVQVNLLPHCL